LFWRLFSAARSAARQDSRYSLVPEQSINVLDTLGNARLLVSFPLPGISRVRCGLSYGRNN
jgi:hypothetical protein